MVNKDAKTRIARNTIILYFRMIISLGVSLYTSRIILSALGVQDFGIYNVVGGIVTMFSFMHSAMTSSTLRFLSFEMGKGQNCNVRGVFSMSINIHLIIAIIVVVLCETIGLWFLNSILVIPPERLVAANYVYQFSLLAFVSVIMSVPYDAVIIAYEKMNVYAYVSIIEVILKLVIVVMLKWVDSDKLITYSVLVFVVSIIVRSIYTVYCKTHFPTCKYTYEKNPALLKEMGNFASWSLFGNIAAVGYNQGINILLNMYFGATVNAARAIAYQLNGAVNNFVSGFQTAVKPQIIKYYSAEDLKNMHALIFQTCRISYFLLLVLASSMFIETQYVLKLWLQVVPSYTVQFCRLILIITFIETLAGPLITAAQATGKMKVYQILVGGLLLLNIPLSFLFLELGFHPEVTFYIAIAISAAAFILRLYLLSTMIHLSLYDYYKKVILKVAFISLISLLLPIYIHKHFPPSLERFLAVCIFSVSSTLICIYFFGLEVEERVLIKKFISKRKTEDT